MTRRMVWVAGVVGVIGLAAMVTGQATQSARPAKAAVVDLQTLLNSLEEKSAVEADLQVQSQQLKQEQAAKEQEINQLKADLEVLMPASEAYTAKQDQLEEKTLELQAWAAYQNQKLNRQLVDQMERLYRKVLDAVEQTAQSSGYDLVLFKEPSINFRGAKREQLAALIQSRKVLWSAPDLEITQQVLALMNNQYRSGGR